MCEWEEEENKDVNYYVNIDLSDKIVTLLLLLLGKQNHLMREESAFAGDRILYLP